MPDPVVMAYSGGKDSTYALWVLAHNPAWTVRRLMVTATRDYGRSTMHGVREALVRQQADALGLPLDIVWIDAHGGGAGYQHTMAAQLRRYQSGGIRHIAFGDLHLEDVRAYRERMNASAGMASLFPIWHRPTRQFSRDVIRAGFKAVVTCVDTRQLDPGFAGRLFDDSLLDDLPPGADPAAERGEFHTFCFDGPLFRQPVRFTLGAQVLRDGRFQYQDLVPAGSDGEESGRLA
jgi:uncharacterized protein (TIGR00290 family)